MFDWLKNIFKKKKVAKQDKGLLVNLEELNDLTEQEKERLIPIKDEKVIARLSAISYDLANVMLAQSDVVTDSAVKQVGGKVYRAVVSNGAKTASGKVVNSTTAVTQGGKVGNALSVVAKNQMVVSAFSVTSIIVGQYFLKQINKQLDAISDNVKRITDFLENEYLSKITSLIKQIKKHSEIGAESLFNETDRVVKLTSLADMENNCVQLLDQATISIAKLSLGQVADLKDYQNQVAEIEKWRQYQFALLEILLQTCRLTDLLCGGNANKQQILSSYTQCFQDYQNTLLALNEYHSKAQEKLKIDLQQQTISKGKVAVFLADLLKKEGWKTRKMPLDFVETIKAQTEPPLISETLQDLNLGQDIELILQNGEVYYLPKQA